MLRIVILAGLLAFVQSTSAQDSEIPPALRDWQQWVLDDTETFTCPYFLGRAASEAGNHACVWPGQLQIDIGADGAGFAIDYHVLVDSWISLPGSSALWPDAVEVNGSESVVVAQKQRPAIQLAAGRHRVSGRFVWDRLPESLPLPAEVALTAVTRDGQAWPAAERRGNALWLSPRQPAQVEQTAKTTLTVQRLIQDGIPLQLTTRVELDVSGPAREEVLGRLLPEGFSITAVNSNLPLRIDENGQLIGQLHTGRGRIEVLARATQLPEQITLSDATGVWPSEEIWAFELNPAYRVAELRGGSAVDGRQVEAFWPDLPNYLLRAGETVALSERSRGLAADEGNALNLQRQLWLDFDRGGYSVEDRVHGEMIRSFRLDLQQPMQMLSASSGAQPLMITRGAQADASGVPALDRYIDITTTARLDRADGSLPVSGYSERMEQVDTTLNLPPGYRLIASSADRAPQAWVERWNVLDVFLVLVIAAACWRLLGPVWGVIAGTYLALGFHETGLPVWSLLVLIVLIGVVRLTPVGTLKSLLGNARNLALVAMVIVALPFVGGQLRNAMFPQLEQPQWSSYSNYRAPADLVVQQSLEAPAPESQAMADAVEEVVVTGSRLKRARYQSDALVQAGSGRPRWSWNQYQLSWSGPVEPQQTTRLLIAPAWLTALLRVVLSGLLLALLLRLIAEALGSRTAWSKRLATSGLVMLALVSPAYAQSTPTPELLDALADRLLEPPECTPQCASVDELSLRAGSDELLVSLQVHVAEPVAVPLPSAGDAWRWTSVAVNGERAQTILRNQSQAWILLPAGIHDVTISGTIGADQVALQFPAPPKLVRRVDADGWQVSGIQNRRLANSGSSGGLTLNRRARVETTNQRGQPIQADTFVRVQRTLSFNNQWTVASTAQRVAPRRGAITVAIPLLPGEAVQTGGLDVNASTVTANFAPQQATTTWQSQLPSTATLTLTATDRDDLVEVWTIEQSPLWQLELAGFPRQPPDADFAGGWSLDYYPRPGEALTIAASRPEPVPGATVAIDQVNLTQRVGARSVNNTLQLTLRASRAEQHPVTLPDDVEVTAVTLNNRTLNLRPQNQQLTVPLAAGESQLAVAWRRAQAPTWRTRSDAVNVGADAANINLATQLPAKRWVLWASGPQRGPAVLYWSELLVMVLVAWALGKTTQTPLRFHHWLLLGLGLSTFFWPTLALLVGWFFVLAWRGRLDTDSLPGWQFNLLQLGLIGLSVLALGALVAAIPAGLLGAPDMHIRGGEGAQLGWFADRSAGELPMTTVWSVPLWWYKALMLAWALWLALALTRWLPWAWHQLIAGRAWQSKPKLVKPSDPNTGEA